MAASSTGLPDKLVSLSKSETFKDESIIKPAEPGEGISEPLVQRCVIIQRDERGYGLTVSGDNPVFVQSVKQDGAAARAGVQQGDRIIKVNGTLVTQSNHQEVVKLIKSGSYVALTLLGKSPGGQGGIRSSPVAPIVLPAHSPVGTGQNNRLSSSSERITGPQPVDPLKQQEVTNTRIHTIKKMYEKEVIFLENLQVQLEKNPTDTIHQQILSASKRVKTLEEQLISLTGTHPDYSAPRSPRSPPSLRQCFSENAKNVGMGSSSYGQGKTLVHQVSAPALQRPDRSLSGAPPSSSSSPDDVIWVPASAPPPSPPFPATSAQYHHPPPHGKHALANRNSPAGGAGQVGGWSGFPAARQISVSTSLENLNKQGNPKTNWPPVGPTHSRQSSSPEALLHNIQQSVQDGKKNHHISPEWPLTRSHSELGHHPGLPRKMSASDALTGENNNITTAGSKRWRPANLPCRGSSLRQYDYALESPHASPPATPPPSAHHHYYGSHVNEGMDGEGIDVDEFYVQEEGACAFDSFTETVNTSFDLSSDVFCEAVHDHNEPAKADHPPPLCSPYLHRRELPRMLTSTPETSSPTGNFLSSLKYQYGTPPEEQSSPTSLLNTQNLSLKLGQGPLSQTPFIVCMEDDELSSDSENQNQLDDHGPFNNLWKLIKNPAHLAVFMQYLISNRCPASLFFYLIAKQYQEGTVKEMKKWAYEIHSSFLVPEAPLRVTNIDETVLHEIDDVLTHHLEKEDIMKNVFVKASKKARETLNKLLAEFRDTRSMGLGSIYGPTDYRLDEAIHDKTKELKIIDQVLTSAVEKYLKLEDPDSVTDRDAVLASSLATVLKQFGLKGQQALNLIDKWPSFVAKEKSRLKFLQRNKKSVSIKNHQFVPQHYHYMTFCNHCQNIIWGVGNQGYQCQDCEMNIHKFCVKVVEESCIGSLRSKKDRRRDRMSGLMENIIGRNRKPSHPNVSAIERAKRLNEDAQNVDLANEGVVDHHIGPKVDRLVERFESGADDSVPLGIPPGVSDAIDKAHHGTKKGASMGRSESFRQRRESRPSFRKRSDPNIPRSKSDVEVDDKTNLNNSGSSSNSSLSASLDSPHNSQEMVHRTPSTLTTDSITNSGGSYAVSHHYDDSDLEAETDPPNWHENVDCDMLKRMKPKEKQRQDVINELFHTERTHVRNLKVLERVFYRPMQQEQLLPPDHLQLLFPNLEEMLEIHGNLNQKMKMQRKEEPVIGNIGETMLQMLDGQYGEILKKAAATFCRNQSIALENLKIKQRKDQKLAQFLLEAEANNMCRRLQLKDIIVTGFQRLTKYPLLLENVAKYCTPNSKEHVNLLKSVECSRQILAHVNQAVKEAENLHRLSELQRNLDKTSFVKTDHSITQAFKNLDFTDHRLIYEGTLTWKLNRQKSLEVHVVLLEDILVLLIKQDEKYVLKFQNVNIINNKEDATKMPPILRIKKLMPRNVATDKKGFFLVTTSDQHAIYEFSAASGSERKIWFKHITEAVEEYKTRNGETKIQEPTLTDRTESTEENNEELDTRIKDSGPFPQDSNCVDNHDGIVNLDMSPQVEQMEPSQEDIVSTASSRDANDNETSTLPPPMEPSLDHKEKDKEDQDGEDRPQQRRLQKVEILQIADGLQLIEPYEVVVRPSAILQTAEPVLTPVERLKRKDLEICKALAEKEELVAKILQVPKEEMEHIVEMSEASDGEKDIHELVLAAMHQANRLSKLLNETLRVTEEDAISATSYEDVRNSPSPKVSRKYGRLADSTTLRSISNCLNKNLTQILATISSREQERKQLRKELHNSREQIHLMHETHRYCTLRSRSPSSCGHRSASRQSRPNSCISVTSSTSEDPLGGVSVTQEDSTHYPNGHNPRLLTSENISGEADPGVQSAGREHSPPVLLSPTCIVLGDLRSLERETSRLSDDGATEVFVDAPATLPLPTEMTEKEECPVTDLDCDTTKSPDQREKSEEGKTTGLVEDGEERIEILPVEEATLLVEEATILVEEATVENTRKKNKKKNRKGHSTSAKEEQQVSKGEGEFEKTHGGEIQKEANAELVVDPIYF